MNLGNLVKSLKFDFCSQYLTLSVLAQSGDFFFLILHLRKWEWNWTAQWCKWKSFAPMVAEIKNNESHIFNAVRIEININGLNTCSVCCWLFHFAFFSHSNWTNTCFLFLFAVPAACQSTELLSVGSCLVQGVLFPGGAGITDGGGVHYCCLMLCPAWLFYHLLLCVSAEERALSRVIVLLESPWECWERCHWPNTQIHLSVLLFFG